MFLYRKKWIKLNHKQFYEFDAASTYSPTISSLNKQVGIKLGVQKKQIHSSIGGFMIFGCPKLYNSEDALKNRMNRIEI